MAEPFIPFLGAVAHDAKTSIPCYHNKSGSCTAKPVAKRPLGVLNLVVDEDLHMPQMASRFSFMARSGALVAPVWCSGIEGSGSRSCTGATNRFYARRLLQFGPSTKQHGSRPSKENSEHERGGEKKHRADPESDTEAAQREINKEIEES
jgi:hypothetical protein